MAGNSLLNNMGGNIIQNMMQNNPMMGIVNALRNGSNPSTLFQQMASKNPQFAQVMQMMNGKSPSEMSQEINQLASQKGIDVRELAMQLGAPKNVIDQICNGRN